MLQDAHDSAFREAFRFKVIELVRATEDRLSDMVRCARRATIVLRRTFCERSAEGATVSRQPALLLVLVEIEVQVVVTNDHER